MSLEMMPVIRVLIVEDEPPILRSLCGLIERLDGGFAVAGTAQDGEQALNLIAEREFDVVFTDIRMPVLSGLRLMEVLSARHPELLIVVISGYGTFEYSAHALRAHAFDYLLKPVSEADMAQLLSRLKQEHMKRRRARLQNLLAAGINKPPLGAPPSVADQEQRLLAVLFRADGDADYWNRINLEALIRELLGELSVFTWVFMGEAPSERVVLLEERAGMVELMEYVHEVLGGLSPTPVGCACQGAGVALAETRAALIRLGEALRSRPEGGGSAFLLLEAHPEDGELSEQAAEMVERVRAYLEENYEKRITNQTLASLFGYVPSYISLLFRKRMGTSPAEFLTVIRLERAKKLIREQPDLMIKTVAERVGFKNQYHFSKAFKKYTGLWPSGYKDGEN